MGSCEGCKWWEPYCAVCFNGESENCADFVTFGCDKYEVQDEENQSEE